MKKFYLAFLMGPLSIASISNAASLDWAISVGGTNTDVGSSISTDSYGNVYVTGNYEGTVDFDSGAGTTNLTSNGSSEIFIMKLNVDGDLIWAKSVGGTGYDHGNSITSDLLGNIFVTGYYEGVADFDPGVATFSLTSNGS
ncbi:SBBP repeat-containing protein, partial [Crocinitomix catalasitica]|nr:SBBP repeat-containing protein [Crocinitomix catalasitica]